MVAFGPPAATAPSNPGAWIRAGDEVLGCGRWEGGVLPPRDGQHGATATVSAGPPCPLRDRADPAPSSDVPELLQGGTSEAHFPKVSPAPPTSTTSFCFKSCLPCCLPVSLHDECLVRFASRACCPSS